MIGITQSGERGWSAELKRAGPPGHWINNSRNTVLPIPNSEKVQYLRKDTWEGRGDKK